MIGHGIVGMICDQCPALHVWMEAALHGENLPVSRHLDRLSDGHSFIVLVNTRAQPGFMRVSLT